jgi:hypothetical protein
VGPTGRSQGPQGGRRGLIHLSLGERMSATNSRSGRLQAPLAVKWLQERTRWYSFYPPKVMISNIGLETPTSLTSASPKKEISNESRHRNVSSSRDEQNHEVQLQRTGRAVCGQAKRRPAHAGQISSLSNSGRGDPLRRRGTSANQTARRLDAGWR